MTVPGSYANGFAPRDGQPLYPELWRGCVGAWAPCLGPTGLTLRDWSGFGNHGTLTNMVPSEDWVASSARYALDFDGTNDYIAISNAGLQKGHLTAAAWVSARSTGSISKILANELSNTQDFQIEFARTSRRISIIWGSQLIGTGTVDLPTSVWTHVAITRSGSTGAWQWGIYVNGVAQSSGTTTHNPNGTSANLAIGRNGDSSNSYFNGQIDDVRLYQRRMSDTELRLLASRRGIAYDFAPRRRSRIFTGGFKAYWAARKAQIIGGGV
jgi:hypothetical protein